jgi:hypothetical protein
MYDPQDDRLFGRDMRHNPPITIALTAKNGWEGSHGRLAYQQIVRTQELNVSEYAIRMTGGVPNGYVIVNAKEVPYCKDTALKVAHNRVAIPVKEYAKHKHLTPKEQWELLNPKWVGTFFGFRGEDPFRSRRPTLEQAIEQAMADDCYDEFMRQFWSPEYEHKAALDRLERRMRSLQRDAEDMRETLRRRDQKITKVVNDIESLRLEWYHLQGYNAHEYLAELRRERQKLYEEMTAVQQKADNIREYLKQMSF